MSGQKEIIVKGHRAYIQSLVAEPPDRFVVILKFADGADGLLSIAVEIPAKRYSSIEFSTTVIKNAEKRLQEYFEEEDRDRREREERERLEKLAEEVAKEVGIR